MTTIDQLPDLVLLEIVRQLPFKERVRLGRVNKRFRQISATIISETECLDLNEGIYRHLNAESFSGILELCSNNLKRMEFPCFGTSAALALIDTFSYFSFQNLVDLDLGKPASLDDGVFQNLIRRNPNLKILKCSFIHGDGEWCTFPQDVVNENLEILLAGDLNTESIASLTGHIPNIKHLGTCFCREEIDSDTLEEFFASCPRIQTFILDEMHLENVDILLAIESFWRLNLREFVSCRDNGAETDGDILMKVGESFSQMEVLLITSDMTNEGIAGLARLSNLRFLTLNGWFEINPDLAVRALVACEKLEALQIRCWISTTTLNEIVRFCTNLCVLSVFRVNVKSKSEAAEIARSLRGFSPTELKIRICDEYGVNWESEEVQAALTEREDQLRKIKICMRNRFLKVERSDEGEWKIEDDIL